MSSGPTAPPHGVSAYTIGKPRRHEMPIRIASQRALVFGDAVVGTPEGLRVWEQTDGKRRERWYAGAVPAPRFQPLALLDIEHILVTHGPSVTQEGGRRALLDAFAHPALVPPRLICSPRPHVDPIYGSGVPSEIVVVPTYNEAEILTLPRAVRARRRRLPVVDDSCPDGTAEVAGDLHAPPWLHLLLALTRTASAPPTGPGSAGRSPGYGWSARDGDLSHPPGALEAMRAAADRGAGLVLGSRYVAGGGTGGWLASGVASSRGSGA